VHFLFAALGVLPAERPRIEEMVRFAVDYTFWLNLIFGAAAAVLLVLHWRGRQRGAEARPAEAAAR
jgi:hypothetical protein